MKNNIRKKNNFFVFFGLLLNSFFGFSQIATIPEKPKFIAPVIDSTNTLSTSQKHFLFEKLKVYSDSTSTEILVMIIPTTHGQEIARYATDLGQKWQIGQKGKDNGIVFLIAKNDKKISIQAGYGTEHLLTDALSRRIIEQVVKPEFKKGNFFQGIDNGCVAIFKVLLGEFKNDSKTKNKEVPFWIIFIIIFIIIIILSKIKGGKGNGLNAGPSLIDIIILSNSGRSGGGLGSFGGSSDGGFGGFGGGGSFGGGGASGNW